jgi:hypothetical protein
MVDLEKHPAQCLTKSILYSFPSQDKHQGSRFINARNIIVARKKKAIEIWCFGLWRMTHNPPLCRGN